MRVGLARGILLAFSLLLAACTGSQQLLEKSGPQPVNDQSLVKPPWETLVKAGPGAANEIDLETLDGPQAVQPVAPPPPVVEAEQQQEAQPEKPKKPKPGATTIRAVAVLAVTGAPGRGNAELTSAMRATLKKAGWPVLNAARKDALTIQGRVTFDEPAGNSQPIHLRWVVTEPNGKSLGDIAQNNAVPAHSLDRSWGEAAGFATQAAAEGIFKLIERYR